MPEETFPAWTLVQAAHVVARGFTAVFAEVGLTPSQFGVLAYLADDDGLTQAELARRVLVRPQSLGELVGPLLERGLVRRDGPGGRGRRSAIVITDEGRAVMAAALPGVRAFNAPGSLGLTAEQLRELDELLHIVLRTVGDAH
ncbi:MarR family winged helix-turn-helix transcriptional regulator [Pseudonocardia sp.]|uniref:MarR family winged helix-turn-helix transcriptional regulator n=1 Tax=Pseudonocardia sp. TaxID=60912 RepID=UPI002609F15A|nr:MarR family winged helix-turn-helix transcriptional regulator [Pseudonocardia sp.]